MESVKGTAHMNAYCDTMPSMEGTMAKKDFGDKRINLYLPDGTRVKIESVATYLIEQGEQGLIKRNGDVNVSALFDRLLERELAKIETTP